MVEPTSLGILLDHVQDKVALLDAKGRFTYANDATERILGWEPSTLVDECAFDYVHPEDVDAVRTEFEATIGADDYTTGRVEYRFRAADGSWVWLESRISNLTAEQLDGYVVSSRNVTDRVAAQRERRDVETRLKELSATTGDVLWMFSADWSELLFVNPAYERVYGRPVDELRADPRRFLDAIHPDDVPTVEHAMARLSDGEQVDIEYRVDPSRGYKRWVWVQGEPIVENGDVARIAGFTRDVSELKRRERQLFVMDNLLRHNLRNELNVVLGTAERIEDASPELSELTTVIRQTGERLLATAEKEREIIDLLTDDTSPVEVDFAPVVADAVADVEERFPAATVDASLPETAPVSAVFPIGLAVVELLENAIRHGAADHPSVSVTLVEEPAGYTLVVEDHAPPMPPIEANVLTGEHDMDDIYHSSGLGLWLVYWLVELSGGTVTVDADDDGNRIAVTLPGR